MKMLAGSTRKGFKVSLKLLLILFLPASLWAQVKFIPNKGQWEGGFLYKAEITAGALFIDHSGIRYLFNDNEAIHYSHDHPGQPYTVKHHAIFFDFVQPKPDFKVREARPSEEFYNYYLSNKPENWATGLHGFGNLKMDEVYPGISLEAESEDDAVKYTWHVSPGADASRLRFHIRGADKIKIKNGELRIYTSLTTFVEQKPIAWQPLNDGNKAVPCKYVLDGDYVSFSFPEGYDHSQPLVVDPTVIFATFSGSKADNFGFTGTYDSLGNGYSGGTVYAANGFPVTPGAFQTKWGGGTTVNIYIGDVARDCGILKYNPLGTKLLFCTYLGGKGNDEPHSMVVDGNNNIAIFGTTTSTNFPVSSNAFQKTNEGDNEIFVTKLSGDSGKLIGSTYLGGKGEDGLNGWIPSGKTYNESPLGFNYGDTYRGEIISDIKSNVYVGTSTTSSDFPISALAQQKTFGGVQDGCIFKMNDDLSKLEWSTFIGGADYDAVYGIQLDSAGNVFGTGGTVSPYFFNDLNTYQNSLKMTDSVDAFIVSVSSDGKSVLNATYFGTQNYDQSFFIQVDNNQDVYIYGQTFNAKFPIVNAKFSNSRSGQFISKFNHSLDKLLFSTTFGSGTVKPNLSPSAFLVDNCGKIFVSGWGGRDNDYPLGIGGNTRGMPITSDAFQANTDGSDFWVGVFAQNMDTILYGSYFGGKGVAEHVDGGTSRFDKRGIIYQSVCGGCDSSGRSFPTTTGAWSTDNKGKRNGSGEPGCNNLLFKVDLGIPDIKADFSVNPRGCYPFSIKPINRSVKAKSYKWYFGDGDTSTAYEPSHTYVNPGTYTLMLVVSNLYSCSVRDTMKKTIIAYSKAHAEFSFTQDTCNGKVTFDPKLSIASTYQWYFGDSTGSKIVSPKHKYAQSGTYKPVLLVDSGTNCVDTFESNIVVKRSDFGFTVDTCSYEVHITNATLLDSDVVWLFDSVATYNDLPSFKFAKPGKHTIRLVIRSIAPCDTVTQIVNIPIRPKPVIYYDFDTCHHTINFNGNNFLDSQLIVRIGSDSMTTYGTHFTFPKPGNYAVKTRRLQGTACEDTATVYVKVPDKKQADFQLKYTPCTRKFVVQSLVYNQKNYTWDFGDGRTDTVPNPVLHTYTSDSTHNIRLIINAGLSCADTAIKPAVVRYKTESKFHWEGNPCTGEVKFHNETPRDSNVFRWTFGDGAAVTAYNANHTYPPGTYKATLVTNPGNACADTLSQIINTTKFSPEKLEFPNVITPDGDGINDFYQVRGIIENCLEYELEIFNRWGQRVYRGKGTDLKWFGTTPIGVEVPAGVYYFIFNSTPTGRLEGTISVIR